MGCYDYGQGQKFDGVAVVNCNFIVTLPVTSSRSTPASSKGTSGTSASLDGSSLEASPKDDRLATTGALSPGDGATRVTRAASPAGSPGDAAGGGVGSGGLAAAIRSATSRRAAEGGERH